MKNSLGAIMVEAGLITKEQLDESLALQKTHDEKLASILVRQSYLTEKFAVTYLGRQLGVPGADLSKHLISLDLFHLVPLSVCRSTLVFPIRLEEGVLQLAMADPLDKELVARLAREHQVRIQPCVALEAAIKNAIEEAMTAAGAGMRSFTPSVLHDRLATFSRDHPRRPVPDTGPMPVVGLDKDREAPIVERLGEDAAPGGVPAVRKVVIVDGNAQTRQDLLGLLGRAEGLSVVVAGAHEVLPQLVDASLLVVRQGPRDNVLELCRQARVVRTHIRIVVITSTARGWAYEADVSEAFGVDLVLSPPLDGPRLRERVEELVGLGAPPPPEREASVQKSLRAGLAALKSEKVDEAIEALQQGLAEDPRGELLHYYLGTAFERKGRGEDAIESYEAAVETNPAFEDALVRLATLYERTGMRHKAVETWQRVLSATTDASARESLKSHILELL
jgi:DNA-binding NarL/FixJ family response regulator